MAGGAIEGFQSVRIELDALFDHAVGSLTQGTTFQNAEADPELITRMARFTTPENNPSVPRLLAAPLGRLLRREEHFSDAEWERTEIHNELYRPRGIYAAIGTTLMRSQYFVPFGVHRNRSRGGFERSHLTALSHIIPHMQRAIQMTLRLNAFAAHANAFEEAWDRLAFGLFVLDGNGRILWANRAGERTLAKHDGLSGYEGSLLAASNGANTKLRQLICEAARAASGDGLCDSGAILIPRHPPALPLSLIVSPLRAEGATHHTGKRYDPRRSGFYQRSRSQCKNSGLIARTTLSFDGTRGEACRLAARRPRLA